MKLNPLSMSNLNWHSPLSSLFKSKTKTAASLEAAGIHNLNDLIWILPRNWKKVPYISPFTSLSSDQLFKGAGKIISVNAQPSGKKIKNRFYLKNIDVYIQDKFSSQTIKLKWFNSYPGLSSQLESASYLSFTGIAKVFNSQYQIINPDFIELNKEKYQQISTGQSGQFQTIEPVYPTINKVSPLHIKKTLEKIPQYLWDNIHDPLPEKFLCKRNMLNLGESFNIFHGKFPPQDFMANKERAKKRLIYQEFLHDHIKCHLRKQSYEKYQAPTIPNNISLEEITPLFSYQLTTDQKSAIIEILKDMSAATPMMRLVQGDVGCGKTSLAIAAAYSLGKNGFQTAIMCPTESLALQHFLTFKEVFKDKGLRVELLRGSNKKSEKQIIYNELVSGNIDIIIGTHSLIQDGVKFKNLGLAIIDEQHKFGVQQRLRLIEKSGGCHCLIMTATPIPRSLSLTQYGDLNITTIKSIPSNRKGTKTKIVTQDTFGPFLNFLNTRLSMGEQAYIVAPAIEDNPEVDMLNINKVEDRFRHFFPYQRIKTLHGKIPSNEKNDIFLQFKRREIDILISTSVIEVGINVPNSTIMAIMGPERFGLSSLHQLRGRVGRGEKPGFCFLVIDKQLSKSSLQRLEILETTKDGFKIAEEDLLIRGEGDLFGTNQSGKDRPHILANIISDYITLEESRSDLEQMLNDNLIDLEENFSHLINKNEVTITI